MISWDNLTAPRSPMLRRSTHYHCAFCGTNLENYGQETCRTCFLPLREDEGMVVLASELGKGMGWYKRLRLGIQSRIMRLIKCRCL